MGETTPSGRTPEQVCREAADYFDTLDELTPLITIKGGDFDGLTLADVMGHESVVQDDLRAVADKIDRLRSALAETERQRQRQKRNASRARKLVREKDDQIRHLAARLEATPTVPAWPALGDAHGVSGGEWPRPQRSEPSCKRCDQSMPAGHPYAVCPNCEMGSE